MDEATYEGGFICRTPAKFMTYWGVHSRARGTEAPFDETGVDSLVLGSRRSWSYDSDSRRSPVLGPTRIQTL